MDDQRPAVLCVVGYEFPGGCRAVSCAVTLEDAAALSALGWTVIPDPLALEALTRFEQWQRSLIRPSRFSSW